MKTKIDSTIHWSLGQTKSYSEIADYIQNPASVRAVGAAIGANPILITVPCHRVIGKNGALTGYRGGLDMKATLLQLELEGASIERSPLHKNNFRSTIDMARYQFGIGEYKYYQAPLPDLLQQLRNGSYPKCYRSLPITWFTM